MKTKSQTKPAAATNETFLVIVHDKCGPYYGYELIRAPDAQAAERVALDKRKAENEQSELGDEEAGFAAILTFSELDLLRLLSEDRPEDEDELPEYPPRGSQGAHIKARLKKLRRRLCDRIALEMREQPRCLPRVRKATRKNWRDELSDKARLKKLGRRP